MAGQQYFLKRRKQRCNDESQGASGVMTPFFVCGHIADSGSWASYGFLYGFLFSVRRTA
jgi:hypothetical protein